MDRDLDPASIISVGPGGRITYGVLETMASLKHPFILEALYFGISHQIDM